MTAAQPARVRGRYRVSARAPTIMDQTNPKHYRSGNIECIDYLRDVLTPEEFRGFCLGNAIKYLSRAGKKTQDSKADCAKARWYSSWLSGNDPRPTDRKYEAYGVEYLQDGAVNLKVRMYEEKKQ